MAETIYTARCKPTNAEVIRAMSDEELADWVWGAETYGRAYAPRGKASWLKWLKSTAESSVFESMKRGLEQAINGETRSETLTKDGEA